MDTDEKENTDEKEIKCPNCFGGMETVLSPGSGAFHTLVKCPVCKGKATIKQSDLPRLKEKWGL